MKKINQLLLATILLFSIQATYAKVPEEKFEKQKIQMASSWVGDRLRQFTTWVGETVTGATLGYKTGVQNAISADCRRYELRGPTTGLCSGTNYLYEVKSFNSSNNEVPQQFQKITWTVGAEDKIVSIAGLDINLIEQDYRIRRNLPPGFPVDISNVTLDVQQTTISYQGTLSHDLSYTYTQSKGYSVVYQGDTIDLDANATNQQTLYANFKFVGALTITANNITGGDPGRSIVVRFSGIENNSKITLQATTPVFGAFGCPSAAVDLTTDYIIKKPTAPEIIGVPSTPLSCLDRLNVSSSYQKDANFAWAFDGGIVNGSSISGLPGFVAGNSHYISGFNRTGAVTILATAYNACGTAYREVILPISNPNVNFKIDATNFSNPVMNPTCAQYEQGFNLSVEPYLPSTVKYTWTLPAGWVFNNYSNKIVKTENVGGINKYTYGGSELAYPRFNSISNNGIRVASAGTVSLKLENVCNAAGTVEKAFNVTIPNQISVSLPQDIVSCNSELSLTPILSPTARAPYRSIWYASGISGQFTSSNFTSNTAQNTFKIQQFGEGRLNLLITDASGCRASTSTYVKMFGGLDNSGLTAGWLSGHLNPKQTKTINSNIAVSKQNRLYFSSTDGRIWFYQFNVGTQKWDVIFTNMTNVKLSVKNNVRYVSSGSLDFLMYIGQDDKINVARLNPTNGQSILTTSITGINPVAGVHGYDAKYIGHDLFEFFYVDGNKGLSYQQVEMDAVRSVNIGSSFNIVGGTNVPFNTQFVDYEFDRLRDRIYYFKTNGGFYMKEILPTGTLGPEVQINTISGSLEATLGTISEFTYDDKNDVYFTANGDVYYVRFDANRNVIGTYKIETVDGISNQISTISTASNSIAINPSTQTIYYSTKTGHIFQLVRNAGFEANPTFNLLKSTPLSINDRTLGNLVYANSPEHLFYVSNSSAPQLYNLFYYDVSQVASCRPQYLRQSAVESKGTEVEIEELSPSKLNPNNLQLNVYPNPFEDKVNITLSNSIFDGVLEVYDLNGNKIVSKSFEGKNTDLDFDNLDGGLYIIKLFGSNLDSPICHKVSKK